jgi:hypothetical protein
LKILQAVAPEKREDETENMREKKKKIIHTPRGNKTR